jgi:hypothetical protein
MKKLGKRLKVLWADESAQGATEYILLLVAIVALVLMFRNKLIGQGGVVEDLINSLQSKLQQFK